MFQGKTTFAAFMVLVLFTSGCDRGRGPTSPSVRPTGVDSFPMQLVISGPDRVAPGSSAQFKASLKFTDQSVRDVTAEATWSSSASEIVVASPGGSVEGRARGEAVVHAMHSNIGITKSVLVLEADKFKIHGWVREAGTNATVREALIETLSPPLVSTMSGRDGRYTLYGLDANSEVKVSKHGYATLVQRAAPTGDVRLDLTLEFTGTRADFSGKYTFSIAAAPECRAVLPHEMWDRSYVADVYQYGAYVYAELAGADFLPLPWAGGDRHDIHRHFIYGEVDGERAILTLTGLETSPYADLIERIGAMLFVPSGTATLTKSDSGFSGALKGSLGAWRQTGPEAFEPTAACASDRHQFRFTR
jgi:hypothetical protein